MSWVNLLRAPYTSFQALQQLPSLQHLACSECQLSAAHFSQLFANSTFVSATSLRFLDFSFNYLHGPIPLALANLTCLSYLDLSWNYNLNSSIPLWLASTGKLRFLDLGFNSFTAVEEGVLGFLERSCGLTSLGLSNNHLEGDLSGSTSNSNNFSECNTYDLETLDMRFNKIRGSLNWIISKFTGLRELYLFGNLLSGNISPTIGTLSSLESLDLGNNSFTGTIPSAVGRLELLQYLDLSRNNLSGVIREDIFHNLSSLNYLALGSNSLVLEPTQEDTESAEGNPSFPKWLLTKNMIVLDLSHCGISVPVPQVSEDLWSSLEYLNLANNNISGSLPESLYSLPQLYHLDLSNNQISGSLLESPSKLSLPLWSLNLANNRIRGRLPRSLCRWHYLGILDLQNNRISGEVPDCLGNISSLNVIDLSSNVLSGTIPSSLWELPSLLLLNLSNNTLEGEVIATNATTRLEILDISENQLSGNIPMWTGEQFYHLRILRLRSNQLVGNVPPQICSLNRSLQIIDFANNHLTGVIPQCIENLGAMRFETETVVDSYNLVFRYYNDLISIVEVMKGELLEYTTNLRMLVNLDMSSNELVGSIPKGLAKLKALHGLNLSHNHLVGSIPVEIGRIKSLESLDLSNNNLSGEIPQSLSALNFLSHLNLSNNNLSGPIPTGNQLQTLDDDPSSVYFGNPNLCGNTLLRRCIGMMDISQSKGTNNMHLDLEDQEEDKHGKICLYIFIMLGLATGFWGVIGTLIINKRWRYAYFGLADEIGDSIYVNVTLSMARLR